MLHFEGLRKKIIKNYFVIIIIVVALFEGLFMSYVQNYYYNSVRQTLESRVEYINGSYNTVSMESVSFEDKVNSIYEKQMNDKNTKYGISIIDNDKNMILDQYGFKTCKKMNFVDVNRALENGKNLTPYTYKISSTDEHVMSISVPIKVNNIVEGAVRYTVSLDAVDREIIKLMAWLVVMGVIILIIAIAISLKFAESLITPLTELKKFANELSCGNYNVKIESNKIVDDEIGELAETFEKMAIEIDKNEKLKNEFISSVSHELRTPLTSIKGWSETLGYEGISKDELDMGLGIIQDETERLINLVEELLDFSRLSSQRIKLVINSVDIENLVIGVVNQLKVKAAEKNIRLLFEFESDNIKNIQGDKNRLRQVLINLVQNSLKFTDFEGFVKITVSQDSEMTVISVTDNGSGIDSENLERVFDKFFQEDYNKAGSGLGLAISNEIVKLHGGSMSIESKKNVGTSITFTLKNKLTKS
ncbi:HAMP domain-containing sensor histidine kinase [Peptacetobacter sp.]|uniref:HAMP domain-containing sensor histidine kinase n=1 Tax=Peptacetobacter sp. TaxID=2991975 RepID=UPI00261884AA|nr:ATP-binding protein [Peptacetobacter sp.]